MRGPWSGGRGIRVASRGSVLVVVGLMLLPARAAAILPLPIHPTRTDDPVAPAGTACSPSLQLDIDCSLRNALADATVDGASVSLGSPSPAGPYMVQRGTALSISHNVNLVGTGARSSVIERTAGTASVLFVSSAVTGGATVQGVTIRDGNAFEGGGIFSDGALIVRDSTITGNQVTGTGGGGIFSDGPSLKVVGSTISGNFGGSGGGIFSDATSTVLVNSTVSGNTAAAGAGGGGIYVPGGTVDLANVTLSSNHAPGGGTGGNILSRGTVLSANTIIAGGTAATGTENCGGTGTFTSSGYNVEDRNECGLGATGDQTNTNPELALLQDNGGQTDTQAPALGSPAVDHGNPAGCTDPSDTLLTVDQRGLTRPQGQACDVGAYELQPFAPGASAITASGIGTTGATLNGTVDTHGFQTTWKFLYGPTTAYGSSTPVQTLASGTQSVSAAIGGLVPNTTYHFALVASTPGGTTQTGDQTFTTAPASGGTPGSGTQPPPTKTGRAAALGPIAITPSVFRAAATGASIAATRRTGATVSYTDTRASTTAFTVLRARAGVVRRGRCVAPPRRSKTRRHGRVCPRYVFVGGFRHADVSGLNRFHFSGRIRRRKLPPGNYRLDGIPHSNGTTGKTVRARFRIRL